MAGSLNLLRLKLRGAAAQLPHLPRALGLVWAAARSWTIAWLVLLIIQGLLPAATVYLTKLLVDALVAAVGAGSSWPSLRPVLSFAALMAGLMLLTELLRSVTSWIRAAQADLLYDHIRGLIHQQSVSLDLAFYDLPEYYDHLHRARDEAGYRPLILVDTMGSLLQNGITLLAMGVVLIPYGVWLPLMLLLSALPAFFVVLRYSLRQHHWRLRNTAAERRVSYYDSLLTTRETAAELRLFGLGDHFRSAFQTLRGRLRGERLRLAKEQSLAELGAGSVALVVTGAAMFWVVWKVLRGAASLGDLALFYQAFNNGQRLMRALLENVGQLYANTLFLGNLFEFLSLEPKIVDPPRAAATTTAALKDGISFDRVTFQYPGSQHEALCDFSLRIRAGQITAIVGRNGAGKSTLIKLLCRFYDPDSGRVEIDGTDVRALPVNELRRLVTVLFQEPVRYSATMAENIALGDLAAAQRREEIEAAAWAAGADEIVAHLPQSYDQLLGKWFAGGTELSVGEWQRIALARAFLRRSPLVILDEPTSALDPWAEADWFERFRKLISERTAIIITHRFTTAMRADVIHVMADGQIIESGAHRDLMRLNGSYAQTWLAQMQEAERSLVSR